MVVCAVIAVLWFTSCDNNRTAKGKRDEMQSLILADSIAFAFEQVTGIGYEKGVSRRDPSDVIKVGDLYYVWYTRIPAVTDGERTPLYNSGYYGTIWYATSSDGVRWAEKGEALRPAEGGSFDSHAVFTPNILKYGDKFYLYFTAVKPTPENPEGRFENNSSTDFTAIGVAVANSPDGPFVRVRHEPVIEISGDENLFDSYRVDDAAALVRDNKVWLYYKGRSRRHGETGPRHTEMGVAFADSPGGPFTKYKESVLAHSHEVLIWPWESGVASLASISQSISFAADGLRFSPVFENLTSIPKAPGLFRPDLIDHSTDALPGWGISHEYKGGDVYLVRYELRSFVD